MVQRGLGLQMQTVGAESLVGGELEWEPHKVGVMHFPRDKSFKTPHECCFHRWKSHDH